MEKDRSVMEDKEQKKKIIVYIDGFNLYYGKLEETGYEWLNLQDLFEKKCEDLKKYEIFKIRYFTSPVIENGIGSKKRQSDYINLLEKSELIEIHKGHFAERKRFKGEHINKLIKLLEKLSLEEIRNGSKKYNYENHIKQLERIKYKEKQTDVNIGAYLMHDIHTYTGKYDCIWLMSNDTDFVGVIQLLKQQYPNVQISIVPTTNNNKIAQKLKNETDGLIKLNKNHLKKSQFKEHPKHIRFYKNRAKRKK